MTDIGKPFVFEIKTTKENFDEVMKNLHEPRITVDFLRECQKTADKLRIEKD